MERIKGDMDTEISGIVLGKLMSISGILQREGNRLLLPYQLNQQQFSILFEIAKAGEVMQKNMINRLALEKAHVSKVVKKLKVMGLIEIIPLPDDKRSAFLKTTSKGRALVEDCRSVFREWNREWFDEFSDEEINNILDSVELLQKVFNKKYARK